MIPRLVEILVTALGTAGAATGGVSSLVSDTAGNPSAKILALQMPKCQWLILRHPRAGTDISGFVCVITASGRNRGIEFDKRSSGCAVAQSGGIETMDAINAFSRLILIPVCAITFYVIVMLAIFFMRIRGWLPGSRPSYRSLGNAFLHL
jgi:hypothetical protein